MLEFLSKCFDRVSQPLIIRQALTVGFPHRTLRGVASFLISLRRRFSCGGYLGQDELTPTNGLLQGDPLSVILCNICVNTWIQAVQTPGIILQGYIDDRTMAATNLKLLAEAWDRSLCWDTQNSWSTNQKKTCLITLRMEDASEWQEPLSIL